MLARNWPRLALLALVLGAVLWLVASGTYAELHVAGIARRLREAGPFGEAAFVAVYVLLQPLGASSHAFVLAAGLVWPPPLAFGLSLLGATLGQALTFLTYRYLVQEWAQKRVPARLARYERVLSEKPFRAVLVARLFTFTAPPVSALIAVSRVPFAPMLGATILGVTPTLAFDIWVGARWVRDLFA